MSSRKKCGTSSRASSADDCGNDAGSGSLDQRWQRGGCVVFQTLQLVSIVLVAGAMTPALAHALEYPGKLRLQKDAYAATQQIYYPGFTYGGGAAEILAILATLLLTVVMPYGTVSFWL